MYGGNEMQLDLMCQACNSSYRRTGSDLATKSQTTITSGDRRIKKDSVVITANEDMQQEIDSLDRNEEVTVLRICSDGLLSDE